MGGEVGDIDAEEIGQQPAMGPGRGQLPLADIGPDQKGAAAAGRVHDLFIAPADTEAVDEVNHFRTGVELAELVTLFGRDEALKDAADDLIIELGKIEVVDLVDERAPMGDGGVGVKRQAVADGWCDLPRRRSHNLRSLPWLRQNIFRDGGGAHRPVSICSGTTILFNWPW